MQIQIDINSTQEENKTSPQTSPLKVIKKETTKKEITEEVETKIIEKTQVVLFDRLNDEMLLFMQKSIEEDMQLFFEEREQDRIKKEIKNKDMPTPKKKTQSQKRYFPKQIKSEKKTTKKSSIKKDRFALKPFDKWFSFAFGYDTSLSLFIDHMPTFGKVIVNISPIKNFFLGVTYLRTLNNFHNEYYQPDFYYTFGYSDWKDNTFDFYYANYADNHLFQKEGKDRFNFNKGTWTLSYKHHYESIGLRYAFNYTEEPNQFNFIASASGKLFWSLYGSVQYKRYFEMDQNQLSLTASRFLYKKIFVSLTSYFYTDIDLQGEQEADYTFSIGWKETEHEKLSITYTTYYLPDQFWFREKPTRPTNGFLTLHMYF